MKEFFMKFIVAMTITTTITISETQLNTTRTQPCGQRVLILVDRLGTRL